MTAAPSRRVCPLTTLPPSATRAELVAKQRYTSVIGIHVILRRGGKVLLLRRTGDTYASGQLCLTGVRAGSALVACSVDGGLMWTPSRLPALRGEVGCHAASAVLGACHSVLAEPAGQSLGCDGLCGRAAGKIGRGRVRGGVELGVDEGARPARVSHRAGAPAGCRMFRVSRVEQRLVTLGLVLGQVPSPAPILAQAGWHENVPKRARTVRPG